MKSDYIKTVLHAYVHVPKIIKRINQVVTKKALASMKDFTSCLTQCEKIINLTVQKAVLIEAKHYIDRAMSRLSQDEKDFLDYKYLRVNLVDYELKINSNTRAYYRVQQKIINTLSDNLGYLGKDDKWFEQYCLKVPFIKKMYTAVKRRDESFIFTGKITERENKKGVA